ncbi:hypothetical protein A3K21_04760 [Candidatus Roizmanbacteria bacterium RIFOXYC1_FULL_38_14]|nr:MAG: hypothetical protein A3K21_04760 [Candidatus Roizmanbacteria bacterium RIFOXYC1_FULL_38_14]
MKIAKLKIENLFMNGLKKNIRIFYLLSLNALKITFQARIGGIFFLIGKIIRVFFIFLFLSLIFSRTRIIKGYTFDQILLFYLTFNIIDTLSQILYREVYRFRPLVVSGGLDMVLLKPFHPFVRVLLGGIDYLDIVLIVPYILLTLGIYIKMGSFHWGNIILYVALLGNSMIVVTAFHIIVLAFGIMTTEVDHTIMIYRDLISMGRFPLEIYKEPIRAVFTFIIPIGVMMNVPAQALLGTLSWRGVFSAFLISLGMLYISLIFWKYALKKYQSWGG